jgi:hypothetical protein
MCSYCGCEAEPVMKALMDDHAEVAALIHEITRALEDGASDLAATRTAQLAELFGRHSESEEVGLFRQLALAGEATGEVDQLLADHRRLRAGPSDSAVTSRPEHLRQLLLDLAHHAEIEDTDLPLRPAGPAEQLLGLIGRAVSGQHV